MFTAFGSAPTSINFAEVYTALQTGVVDGQENPLAIIKVAKMWEVQKYVSMTNHMWDGFWMLANRRAWGALPEDLQQIVAENFNKAGMDQRRKIGTCGAARGHGAQIARQPPACIERRPQNRDRHPAQKCLESQRRGDGPDLVHLFKQCRRIGAAGHQVGQPLGLHRPPAQPGLHIRMRLVDDHRIGPGRPRCAQQVEIAANLPRAAKDRGIVLHLSRHQYPMPGGQVGRSAAEVVLA